MRTNTPIQLVIPMAGLGTRFTNAGYQTPKPLLPVHGVPVYHVVLANLLHPDVTSVTIIAQKAWHLQDDINHLNERLPPDVRLLEIDYTTGGPAETVELTRPFLDPDLPVVTGNSDQYVDADLDGFYTRMRDPDIAGLILTMEDDDPKWSFAALAPDGYVTQVKEKQVISHCATVGVYGFKTASLMFHGFDLMRAAADTHNGEYYVAPSYNHLITQGHRIAITPLGPFQTVMHGLGIPKDYERFLASPASHRGVEAVDARAMSVRQ